MEEENIKLILSNINKIYNKDTDEIFYNKENKENNIDFIKYKHKNSNTNAIYKLKANNKIINKNNPFMIEYNCIICNKRNIFRLNNIVRKINRNIKRCIQCVNSCPDKIIMFMDFQKVEFKTAYKDLYPCDELHVIIQSLQR